MFVLHFFKLPESSEGLGHSILLTRIGHRGLWPHMPQWHLLSFFIIFFAFFPHFYGNFWQCPLYYAVQHNLKKKTLLNFQQGQMSGFFEQDWTFGWQSSSWQSREKFLCGEAFSKMYNTSCACGWLDLCSASPAWSKGRVTAAEKNQPPVWTTCIFLGNCMHFSHCAAPWVSLQGQGTLVNLSSWWHSKGTV